MVNVIDARGRRLATLNHRLVLGGLSAVELPGTFLDPMNEQCEVATQVLR